MKDQLFQFSGGNLPRNLLRNLLMAQLFLGYIRVRYLLTEDFSVANHLVQQIGHFEKWDYLKLIGSAGISIDHTEENRHRVSDK